MASRSPSANPNRSPKSDTYRYCACVSWVWLVPRAKEVEAARTAGPVFPGFSLDKESPAGELAPTPLQEVLSAPITPAMPFARPT